MKLDINDSYLRSNPEAYLLKVENNLVSIRASAPSGMFYGIQSLLQLLPAEIYDRTMHRGLLWTVPAVEIQDAPERPWRGMMIDVARYFYDMTFLKKFVDMMAMYKMNVLQIQYDR